MNIWILLKVLKIQLTLASISLKPKTEQNWNFQIMLPMDCRRSGIKIENLLFNEKKVTDHQKRQSLTIYDVQYLCNYWLKEVVFAGVCYSLY